MTAADQSSTNAKRSARERLLDAAAELFYAHGVTNVGIDAIIERAGVAKMSLYNHFKSKDALIAATLERRDEEWFAWLDAAIARHTPPRGMRTLAFFDALGEWFAQPDFRGCPFINAQTEVADVRHPAQVPCERHTERMRATLERVAREDGRADAEPISRDLLLLVEGAVTLAAATRSVEPAKRAKRIAAAMLAE